MSEQNSAFMLRWYNEVWNNENETAIDEMFHPQGKAYGLNAEPLVGPEQFKPFYRMFKEKFSNIKINVDKTLADGDYVITMCTVKATYRPTGKPVEFGGVAIGKIVDGKLIEGWNYFDFLGLNLQTGNIKPEQLS